MPTNGRHERDDELTDEHRSMLEFMDQVDSEAERRFLEWHEREREIRDRLQERHRVLRQRIKIAGTLNGIGLVLALLPIGWVLIREGQDWRYIALAAQHFIVAGIATMTPFWLMDPIYRERGAHDVLMLVAHACGILAMLNFALGSTLALLGRPDLDGALTLAGWTVLALSILCLGIAWSVRPWRGNGTRS